MTPAGSPGTYGPTPPRHPWAPLPLEPGARARCQHCPQPRHEHEEGVVMKPRYGPVFESVLRDERPTPSGPRVTRNGKGEVWRHDPAAPKTQHYKRRRFLGWVDFKDEPKPPHWPTAGWWAGAGVQCHVTGLDSMAEAMFALLDSYGIDLSEWER